MSIETAARDYVFAHFGLLKTSETAYQRAVRKGLVTLEEVAQRAKTTPDKLRASLGAFTQGLSSKGLLRDQRFQALRTAPLMAHHNVKPENLVGAGPTASAFGVFVSPDAGTSLRILSENKKGSGLLAGLQMESGKRIPPRLAARLRKPQDPGITNSIVAHELAEKAMLDAVSKGYKAPAVASHAGPGAVLAERVGVKDPAVLDAFDKLRTLSADDAEIMRLAKQHGMVGNYVPAPGGRAHRSLDLALERAAVGIPAAQNRIRVSQPVTGPLRRRMEMAQRAADFASGFSSSKYAPLQTIGQVGTNVSQLIAPFLAVKPRSQMTPEQVKAFIATQSR